MQTLSRNDINRVFSLYNTTPDFKLILTPLLSITDEDIYELLRIEGLIPDEVNIWRENYRVKVRSGDYVLEIKESVFELRLFYQARIAHLRNEFLMMQFLISKNYNIRLYFSPGHWANFNTAVGLGLAELKK